MPASHRPIDATDQPFFKLEQNKPLGNYKGKEQSFATIQQDIIRVNICKMKKTKEKTNYRFSCRLKTKKEKLPVAYASQEAQ